MKQRGFAGAAGSNDGDEFAAGDGEIGATQGLDFDIANAKRFFQVADFNDGIAVA
jgi:hypothetical protein